MLWGSRGAISKGSATWTLSPVRTPPKTRRWPRATSQVRLRGRRRRASPGEKRRKTGTQDLIVEHSWPEAIRSGYRGPRLFRTRVFSPILENLPLVMPFFAGRADRPCRTSSTDAQHRPPGMQGGQQQGRQENDEQRPQDERRVGDRDPAGPGAAETPDAATEPHPARGARRPRLGPELHLPR